MQAAGVSLGCTADLTTVRSGSPLISSQKKQAAGRTLIAGAV